MRASRIVSRRTGIALLLSALSAACEPERLAEPQPSDRDATLSPSFTTAPLVTGSLVRTIAVSDISPPSPDPSGIAYLSHVDRLLIGDSKVDETVIFTGVNLYELTLAGSLFTTSATLPHSDAPTGLAYNPANRHLFISDDTGTPSVYEWDFGPDSLYGTSDDVVTSFSTSAFGSSDPEGVTFDVSQGVLFIVDGSTAAVYRIAPGPNGAFDGTDDVVTTWDTAILGLTQPEGIAWDSDYGHLYLAGTPNTEVFHVTTDGTLLRRIDISAANPHTPSGLAFAPSSGDPSVMSLYVVDRAVDNNADPNENDGKVYEFSLPAFSGNRLPTIAISAPASGTRAYQGDPVTFTATASDVEEGDLTASITWTSSRDGDLGAGGGSITTSTLSLGTHTITASVTDSAGAQASDAVPVTIEGPRSFTVRVASGDADAEEGPSGGMSRGSSDLELVFDGGDQTVGLRFTGVSIPRGATITAASVQFQADESTSEITSLTIQAETADDAPPFTSGAGNISTRSRTTASVPWSPVAWTKGDAGPDQETPDIAAVIHEVVNRSGWSSGNALVVIVTGSGRRVAESWEGVASAAALLRVEYLEPLSFPPAVTIATPVAQSVFAQDDSILFSGTATDPEDGDLTANIAWASDLDGLIGTGGSFTRTSLSVGYHTVTATVVDINGQMTSSSTTITVLMPGTALLVGAGDIAICGSNNDEATAQLLDGIPGTVFTVGDNAYPKGSNSDYNNCYQPTWGRHKARTRPTVGDNEYSTSGASGYFNYFGAAGGNPGEGYYSYNAGSWLVIVLNSNCSQIGGCGPNAPQGQWLQAVLDANPRTCILAMHHEPLFSSSGGDVDLGDLWLPLFRAGADIVLSGHRHNYERFAQQHPGGDLAPGRGIRQIVVGTGGAGLSGFGQATAPHSEIRNDNTHGVLKLTLHPTSYDWEFVPVAGATFTDSGSEECVVPPPNTPPTASAVTITGTAVVGQVLAGSYTYADADWDAESTPTYRWLRDAVAIAGATARTYTVTAADIGASIRFEVTPAAQTGVSPGAPVQSAAVGPVPANAMPTASFAEVVTDLTVSLTDQSTDLDGTIASWAWSFGDGNTSTLQNPTHTYAAAGTYTISLTVTDNLGGQGSASRGVTVTAPNQPPTASDVAVTGVAVVGNVVTGSYTYVDVHGDAEGASTVAWLRDGAPIGGATARTYTVVAADLGTLLQFEVTPLALSGPSPGVAVQSPAVGPVAVTNTAPTAAFTDVVTDLVVVFTDGSTDPDGTIARWAWSFGDGNTSTLQSPTHTYLAGGTYTVSLTVRDNLGAESSTSHDATVTPPNQAPTASDALIAGVAEVGRLLMGSYTYADGEGDAEGTSTYRWLRDGAAIAGATAPSYALVAADEGALVVFEVTPVATSGASPGVAVHSPAVGPVAPANTVPTASNPTITGLAEVGRLLMGSYTYTDVEGDAEGTSTYRWLRDGAAIGGATDQTYAVVTADAGALLQFEVTPVAASGASPGSAVQSPAVGPVAEPVPTGLEVRVASGGDDAEEAATGQMSAGSSDLELVFDGSNQTVGMRFNGVAVPSGATITNAYIQFQADEATSEVTTLAFEGEATDNAAPFATTSGAISSRSRTASAVGWSPVPWLTRGEAGPNQRTPNLAPIVQEIVTRSGWSSGNSLVIIVTGTGRRVAEAYNGVPSAAPLLHVEFVSSGNAAPSAAFGEVAANLVVGFTDQSFDPDGTIASWQWSFGDGSTSTIQHPTHTYATGGTYTVSLTVTDNFGAQGSTSRAVTVTASNRVPTASDVVVTGVARVGQLLTGSYTYTDGDGDAEGNSRYEWLRDGVAIAGATAPTYTVMPADVGTLLQFEVTPVAQSGASPGVAVQSPAVGPVAGTPSGGSMVEVRVASGGDDVEEAASGSVSMGSSDLELVLESSVQTVGMRFNGVTIPAGATITNAYIQFQADETGSDLTSLLVEGEAADNAAAFVAVSGNVSSRTRTASSVAWSPVPWLTRGEAGPDQRTTNLAPVLQEIVNRPGWSSGNALVIIITGSGKRTAESYDGVPTAAPLLHVDYTVGT